MKKVIIFLFLILLMACSNDVVGDSAGEKQETEDKAVEESSEETQSKSGITDEIVEISLATDFETIQQLPAGVLTKDIPYEKDTAQILFGLDELDESYQKELKNAVAPIADETDDPETIAKSLIYYAGSPSLAKIATDLENFEPSFKEPLLPRPEKVQNGGKIEGESHAYILLDASSSMLLESEGTQRMHIARQAVSSFAQTIGESSQVSLVAFGHKGDDSDQGKATSCSGIEEVYSLADYDDEAFTQSVNTIEAKGWTPLAAAIEKVSELSSNIEGHITIYIVSDGVETCDGDPVKAAETFAGNADNKTVNIIGFQVDQEAEAQLTKVADAGKGEYYAANNEEDLLSTIEYEWLPSTLDLVWAPVNKTPDGFDITYERQEVDELSYGLRDSMKRENHRFETVLDLLLEDEMITESVKQQIEEILSKREEEIKAWNEDLRETKRDAVVNKADEIKAKVDAWVKEMEAIKESVQ
ncbi:VWA domain-containing protein [Gracilibacillus oryzae]|uniref:VWA domain-containing protein n=1 Tax=Gracilibacillus oryzae TaxID=1672701 RepID=A0A7C8L1W2_9BACI|nr:VWA domain-containing protein [Gracilibacillus oryzae]KAB8127657.1 VWA domain-containing protein [Gracilibacillus oryzae]